MLWKLRFSSFRAPRAHSMADIRARRALSLGRVLNSFAYQKIYFFFSKSNSVSSNAQSRAKGGQFECTFVYIHNGIVGFKLNSYWISKKNLSYYNIKIPWFFIVWDWKILKVEILFPFSIYFCCLVHHLRRRVFFSLPVYIHFECIPFPIQRIFLCVT